MKRYGVIFILILLILASLPPATPRVRAEPKRQNGCGSGGWDVPDAPLIQWLGSGFSASDFRDVCNVHDGCYGMTGTSKEQCDDQFWQGLVDVCNQKYPYDPFCLEGAQLYYLSVWAFGHWAYQNAQFDNTQPPYGQILEAIPGTVDGDELVVFVLIGNGGGFGEFELELRSSDFSEVDEEPDTYWVNLYYGDTWATALTTNWDPFWNLFDLGRTYYVVLREYHTGEEQDRWSFDTPLPQAQILSVEVSKIDDWFSDDEFEACVLFENYGDAEGEFDIKLYAADGDFIDEEPDGYWADVSAGSQKKICVGTNGIWPSWSDMKGGFTVVLNEEHLGEMDRRSYTLQ